MASEVKANKLSPSSGTTVELGDSGDEIKLVTGVTLNVVDGVGVAGGGTGLVSFTAGDVLYATGSTTLAKLAKGSAEEVLSMNSGANAPEWTTAAATAGGTGQTGFTAGDLLYANSTTTLTKLGKGTARQGLQTNSGATAPEWVNSPQSLMTAAGDIIYASGANTLAKLAKGSDDEVLTLASGVPSWAEAGGGGAWTQISTQTASADATIDFTTLSADYRDFKVIASGVNVSVAADMWFRVDVGSGFVTATDYLFAITGHDSGGTASNNGSGAGAASFILCYHGWDEAATFCGAMEVIVYDVHNTTNYKMMHGQYDYWDNVHEITCGVGSASCTSATTAITGLRFQPASGNFATGEFTLYGRKIT